MLAVTGIVLGVSALGWLVIWQVYRIRRFCPACKERALRFLLGYRPTPILGCRPTRIIYFECTSCRAHLRAEINFLELTLNSYGIRLRKHEYNYEVVSDHEWEKFFPR
jgi:hypothetical protein